MGGLVWDLGYEGMWPQLPAPPAYLAGRLASWLFLPEAGLAPGARSRWGAKCRTALPTLVLGVRQERAAAGRKAVARPPSSSGGTLGAQRRGTVSLGWARFY